MENNKSNMELIQCLKEIQEFPILIETLTEHEKQPNNNKIEQIVLDNLTLAYHSMRVLNKEKHVPSKCMLNNIIDRKLYSENYFRKHGYESRVSKKLGKVYKETLSLIKRITSNKVKIDLTRLSEDEANLMISKYPNLTYKFYLHKYKSEIRNKIARGEQPFLSDVQGHSDLAKIKQLAIEDARNWSFSGMDNDRGDLRKFYGTETMGELLDESVLHSCNKITEEQEQKHLEALGLNKEETLNDIDRIVEDIILDCQSRKLKL